MVQNVGAYNHYVNQIYYKTLAGLKEVPTNIPAEARQVQLYNNAICNNCAKNNCLKEAVLKRSAVGNKCVDN